MKTERIVLIVVTLASIVAIVYVVRRSNRIEHTCKQCQKARDGELLPVSDAAFTMWEAGKQLVLLEGHLNDPKKRCKDCITKHCALAEGLCEEAVGLNGGDRYRDCYGYSKQIRQTYDRYLKGDEPQACAQMIRGVRKNLLRAYSLEI